MDLVRATPVAKHKHSEEQHVRAKIASTGVPRASEVPSGSRCLRAHVRNTRMGHGQGMFGEADVVGVRA